MKNLRKIMSWLVPVGACPLVVSLFWLGGYSVYEQSLIGLGVVLMALLYILVERVFFPNPYEFKHFLWGYGGVIGIGASWAIGADRVGASGIIYPAITIVICSSIYTFLITELLTEWLDRIVRYPTSE